MQAIVTGRLAILGKSGMLKYAAPPPKLHLFQIKIKNFFSLQRETLSLGHPFHYFLQIKLCKDLSFLSQFSITKAIKVRIHHKLSTKNVLKQFVAPPPNLLFLKYFFYTVISYTLYYSR